MKKRLVLIAGVLLSHSGCTISSKFLVDDEPYVRSAAGPSLAITTPAQCNEYPVEYRRGGAGSESTTGNIDFWFFARKPDPCRKRSVVEDIDDEKRPFWRFWK